MTTLRIFLIMLAVGFACVAGFPALGLSNKAVAAIIGLSELLVMLGVGVFGPASNIEEDDPSDL